MLAVGYRGFRRIGVLDVPRFRRNTAVRFALPRDLAGGEINCVDDPSMFSLRRRSFAAKVEALLRRLDVTGRNDGGDEDAVAPRNRRRPAVAGDDRFPRDVLGGAPLFRK